MRRAITWVLALILMWTTTGYTSEVQALTALFREEPNYKDAVIFLGEPDEEQSSAREAYVAYEKHLFCGLEGTLALWFKTDSESARAADYGLDHARWSAQGGEAEIQQAAAEIMAAFDEAFGTHKPYGNGLIWRNENRVKIIVCAEKEAIEIAFGCDVPQKLTALFTTKLTYDDVVALLGKPDIEGAYDPPENSYTYAGFYKCYLYGLEGLIGFDFEKKNDAYEVVRVVWAYGDERRETPFSGGDRQKVLYAMEQLTADFDAALGRHEDVDDPDVDEAHIWKAWSNLSAAIGRSRFYLVVFLGEHIVF